MKQIRRHDQATHEPLYQDGKPGIAVQQTVDLSGVAQLKRTVNGTNGIRYQYTGQSNVISRKELLGVFAIHLA